jgi:hypothetical protein
MLLSRLVMTVAALIALLIALGILLFDIGANPANTVVHDLHEGANFFAGGFTDMVTFHGRPKVAITVNWGIALLIYLVVGALAAIAISSAGLGGRRVERVHRAPV